MSITVQGLLSFHLHSSAAPWTASAQENKQQRKECGLLHQHPVLWQLLCDQGWGLAFPPRPGHVYSASPIQTGKLSTSLSPKASFAFTNAEYEISLQLLKGSTGSFCAERKVKGVPHVSQMQLISSMKGTRKEKRRKSCAFCPVWFSLCLSLALFLSLYVSLSVSFFPSRGCARAGLCDQTRSSDSHMWVYIKKATTLISIMHSNGLEGWLSG